MEPNDDIELLTCNVYFDIRNFREAEAFTADLSNPDQTRSWNERSSCVRSDSAAVCSGLHVVAVLAQGTGAVAAEYSYGITFGNSEWRV